MVMTTFEYYALLEKLKEEKNNNKKQQEKELSSFRTWKEQGIIYDEWGNAHLGIVEKTGFEGEGA